MLMYHHLVTYRHCHIPCEASHAVMRLILIIAGDHHHLFIPSYHLPCEANPAEVRLLHNTNGSRVIPIKLAWTILVGLFATPPI